MEEEIQMYLDDTKENMQNSIKHLTAELLKLRAGKANPHMLSGIKVDYYGTITPLAQIANVSTSDAHTLVIQPWEKAMIDPIEKEVRNSNMGFNPVNNGELIRINVPMLTEERRRALVKEVKAEGEKAKISIRNIRKDVMDEFKKMLKDGLSEDAAKDAEGEAQKLTDSYVKNVDDAIIVKEKEVMTV